MTPLPAPAADPVLAAVFLFVAGAPATTCAGRLSEPRCGLLLDQQHYSSMLLRLQQRDSNVRIL